MVLYLTSKMQMNILDFLTDAEELIVKKYVGEFDLKEFLGKSLQRLGHVEAIVVDRSSLTGTTEEIINAVRTFMPLNKIRIIFYIPDQEQSLVHELIGIGIFNFITDNDVEGLREEIKMCILEGMSEQYIKNKFGLIYDENEKSQLDFKEKQITIGVAGSQHRVGTTTVAMQFAYYLDSIGAKVSYVEANDSGHLKLIAEHYGMEKNGDGYLYQGIAFEGINSKNDMVFDFIVYDLGVLNENNKVGFVNCKVRIICVGNKPHEIPFYKSSLESLDNIECNIMVSGVAFNMRTIMTCEDMLTDKYNERVFEDVINISKETIIKGKS